MFGLRKQKEPTDLECEIERILIEMNMIQTDTEEYQTLLSHLERLSALLPDTRRKPISSDSMVAAGANLAGILLIVAYEQKHVITSKALGFIGKPK